MIGEGNCRAIGGMKIGRGKQSTRRKPDPAPLCPPQIPLDQIRDRTRAAAMGSQWLTASAMARPLRIMNLMVIIEIGEAVDVIWLPQCTLSHSLRFFLHLVSVEATQHIPESVPLSPSDNGLKHLLCRGHWLELVPNPGHSTSTEGIWRVNFQECYILGYDALYPVENQPTFRGKRLLCLQGRRISQEGNEYGAGSSASHIPGGRTVHNCRCESLNTIRKLRGLRERHNENKE
jgi:hypothetical protein